MVFSLAALNISLVGVIYFLIAVAVVAFLDPRIAAAVRDAVHVVDGLVLGKVSHQDVSSKL